METRFPFGIDAVMELDRPDIRRYQKTGTSADYDCPFCGGKRKLHLDFTKNAFRCNVCHEENHAQGGLIQLHCMLKGLPYATREARSAAYRDLLAEYEGLSEKQKNEFHACRENDELAHVEGHPAPADVLDLVYRAFLDELKLKDSHRRDLLRRGLTEAQIDEAGFRSVPRVGFCTYAENALMKSGALQIEDQEECLEKWAEIFREKGSVIPGFYLSDSGRIAAVRPDQGYFIPVKDCLGRIAGMQIRFDPLPENAPEEEKDRYHRYAWFSSAGWKQGCSVRGVSQIHFAGFSSEEEQIPETVGLTEGALKADVASAISGKPFIALIGVGNQEQLPSVLGYLKDHGTKRISVFVDMDLYENAHVASALKGIEEKVTLSGLEFAAWSWDRNYKGIDDWLLECRNRGRITEASNLTGLVKRLKPGLHEAE